MSVFENCIDRKRRTKRSENGVIATRKNTILSNRTNNYTVRHKTCDNKRRWVLVNVVVERQYMDQQWQKTTVSIWSQTTFLQWKSYQYLEPLGCSSDWSWNHKHFQIETTETLRQGWVSVWTSDVPRGCGWCGPHRVTSLGGWHLNFSVKKLDFFKNWKTEVGYLPQTSVKMKIS